MEKLQSKDIDSFTYYTICEMAKSVTGEYTQRYNEIRKEVFEIMQGKIIEYQARTDYFEGLEEGHKSGLQEGLKNGIEEGKKLLMEDLLKAGLLKKEDAERFIAQNKKE